MTTKHTPGPWHVSADGFDESKQAFRFLVSSPARKGQSVDDARLIAAAPYFLAALEKIAVGLDKNRIAIRRMDGLLPVSLEVLADIAEAAIKKAMGE